MAGGSLLTGLFVTLWYASSIITNQSAKLLLPVLGVDVLTLTQFIIATGCGALVLAWSDAGKSLLDIRSRAQLLDMTTLTTAFLGGSYLLNVCLNAMHVSLAMVLRAAEVSMGYHRGTMGVPWDLAILPNNTRTPPYYRTRTHTSGYRRRDSNSALS